MTTLYMLDTNTISYVIKGRSAAARGRLLGLGAHEAGCISAVTEGEIRYGLERRPEAVALRRLAEMLLASIRVVPWGRDEAQAYGELRAKMEASGKVLGHMDMLIAAHAVALGAVLVTSDKAFRQVDGLRGVEDWAGDLG